ncbi:MAG: glycosyltransferase, partial [Vicingaceae bacterium]
ETYSFLKTEAKHLKIDFLVPCGQFLFLEKAILNYIKKNASEIDVIHFFHLTKETIYYALQYIKYNPKGNIYIKMDVNNDSLEKGIRYSRKNIFNWFHKIKEKQFFKSITAISTENPTSLALLKKSFPLLKDKAFLLPNGVNNTFLKEQFPSVKSYSEKENVILSVGRIGADDKNFEMLLYAFSQSNLLNWKLIFVGPVENDFDKKVADILTQKPHLSNNIILTGAIEDRTELYEYYNKSKICCLTSRLESFGITFIESMYFGNYVIGTKGMSSFNYISNNLELGSVVDADDENSLSVLLKRKTNDEEMLAENYLKAQEQIEDKFYWSKIIKPLAQRLA